MEKAYLGQAIKFPIVLKNGGSPALENGNPLVSQSITIILNTPIGSRFMLPEYGSRLRELIFEPNDEVLIDLMKVFIYEALSMWEKRARFTNVTFEAGEDIIYCTIYYRVLASNEVESFVYPFYRGLKY